MQFENQRSAWIDCAKWENFCAIKKKAEVVFSCIELFARRDVDSEELLLVRERFQQAPWKFPHPVHNLLISSEEALLNSLELDISVLVQNRMGGFGQREILL